MDRCPNCGYDPNRHEKTLLTEHQFEIGCLRILLAWEMGELSEGQASRLLARDRLSIRAFRDQQIEALKADMPNRWALFQAERATGA